MPAAPKEKGHTSSPHLVIPAALIRIIVAIVTLCALRRAPHVTLTVRDTVATVRVSVVRMMRIARVPLILPRILVVLLLLLVVLCIVGPVVVLLMLGGGRLIALVVLFLLLLND